MVIRDGLAADKATLLWAAIAENLERQDFDVIEEANAVEAMVAELGSAKAAAERLNRTEGLERIGPADQDWFVPPADHVVTRYEEKKLGDTAPIFLQFRRV